ncbi:MAG: FtsX-like permease family protein [Cyclobacteriaceae bacterium]
MLRNYLLVSLRNIKRHFTYSFVNIFGLTVGLACTMIIGMWVYQEFNYDRHFEDSDKIYRVGVNFFNVGNMAIGPEILKEKLLMYPQVEQTTNLGFMGEVSILVDNREIAEEQAYRADEDFFRLFSYDFLKGNADALDQPGAVVISEALAMKLFGTTDVLNRTIEIKNDPIVHQIQGVVSTNKKSHIPAQFWVSTKGKELSPQWNSASSYAYAKLNTDTPAQSLDEALNKILETDVYPAVSGDSFSEFMESGIYVFLPMSIHDIHLRSELKFENSTIGNEMTTQIFGGVALLILVLASINFVNISTARATVRAKEIGIRKSLGTSKSQLVLQFILESVIICLIAVGFGMIIGDVFLQAFESLTGLELLNSLFDSPIQIGIAVIGAVLLGVLAGIYPALYITRFKPVIVLKGNVSVNEKGALRSGLVLFQFVISISLLIVSIFVFNQLNYIQNKDLGFETENVLIIRNSESLEKHGDFLNQELKKLPQVVSSSMAVRIPATNTSMIESVNKEGSEEDYYMQRFVGDYEMVETFGFRLVDGRNFSKDLASDSTAVLLNEAAVREFGFEDPIGQTLNDGSMKIIGVVSDFNFESLQKGVSPVMIRLDFKSSSNLMVKFSGSNPDPLINELKSMWEGLGTAETLDYYFLDENFERMVTKERTLSKAVLLFTILAMFISCLGLYGLSVFTAERRVKEIGIRRVLGASVASITRLLSGSFAIPIIIAFIISIPISYLAVDSWLSNYANRVAIDPWVFLTGGIMALVTGLITVSWQSIKTALKNPVVSLRNE